MNDFKSEFIEVPEGFFLMGADELREEDAEYSERPERKVWMPTYKIQKMPVTVKQWNIFLEQTGYEWDRWILASKLSPSDDHPIVHVSWLDADIFTHWLSEEMDADYRLPTEAQWEKACRGQHGQLFPWGNEAKDWLDEYHQYTETNLPVGSQLGYESPYGCLDMWGNVSEWCLDWFDYGDYVHSSPAAWVNPVGPSKGEWKTFRGGNPLTSEWPRCTYRGICKPESHHNSLGFRVVKNNGLISFS